ncbi:MAG: competence/damage-inducible protein A [Candidatus Binatia bacterium]|nr:competence/damage-inducible protein A [Candidatus Binatia bacterium]
MALRVAILSTGEELTTGKIADTNAQWLADRCFGLGIDVAAVLVVGDDRERITWAWERAFEAADLVVCTGGLGPTTDDLTTQTVAAMLGEPLRFDEASAEKVRQLFAAMNREMPESNLRQALFPESATILENPLGTAPGYRVTCERSVGGAPVMRHLVVMPGVPREMKPMFDERVLPWLTALPGVGAAPVTRVFQTFGMSESALGERVSELAGIGEVRVSYRASFPKIAVKLILPGDVAGAEQRIEGLACRVREALGPVVYAEGEATMEEEVGRVLLEKKATVAVAESCTGGLIGHRLTDVPGCSAYFLADFVTYSNEAKASVLGVLPQTLEAHGAVSEEAVREMAAGARRRSGADVAIATSGIAGPGGGTEERPVGTVCFGLDADGVQLGHRLQLWGNRDWIKTLTSQIALDWIRRWALGLPVLESGFRS